MTHVIPLADLSCSVWLGLFVITHWEVNRACHPRTSQSVKTSCGSSSGQVVQRKRQVSGVYLSGPLPMHPAAGLVPGILSRGLCDSAQPCESQLLTHTHTHAHTPYTHKPHTDWGARMCIFVQHSQCLLDTGEHWLLEKDKINHSGDGEKEKKMIKKKTCFLPPFKCHRKMSRKLLYWK